MFIVTGGAGFIGSNLISFLNAKGINDIVVIDNLKNGRKFANLVGCRISDFVDKEDFIREIQSPQKYSSCKAIFHLGACSATTEWDGKYLMENNYQYSKKLLDFSQVVEASFIYASSAAVYGTRRQFKEDERNERPVNVYAYSKLLFDNYVRANSKKFKGQVVGLRYFNVYGPGEAHKGQMASTIYHFNRQVYDGGRCKLFGGAGAFGPGEQLRDFVYVKDCAALNYWFYNNPNVSGIFNVGSGEARPFNDVAKSVIKWHGFGEIEYIPFPEHLMGAYQDFTCADLSMLRKAGYSKPFTALEDGVYEYLDAINE